MILIVDYGVGNIGSISNMLRRVGENNVLVSNKTSDIEKAKSIILPGVGSFDHGIRKLRESGCVDYLNHRVLVDKIPILGICLGAQLITKGSEEGVEAGLGWVNAYTRKFKTEEMSEILPIPHMGWSDVKVVNKNRLLLDLPADARFYFVHSYHMVCENIENEMLSSCYGYDFTSGIFQNNIYGVQFHPEKSHKFGMNILASFCRL